jgi:uncharacterized protein YdbL (DUF1318 family)
MTVKKLAIVLFAASVLMASSATSQSLNRNIARGPNGEPLEGYTSINSTISLAVPYDDQAEVDAQIEAAQASLYKLAASQCALTLGTIADDCKLVGFNSSVDLNRNQRADQIMIRSTIVMNVKLKSALVK